MNIAKSAFLVAFIAISFLALVHASPVKGGDLTSFIGNNNDTRYQANSTINSSNIAGIVQQWEINSSLVTSNPVVLNGTVYFDDWNGNVYSVNVLTGTPNWIQHLQYGMSSTPLLANGMVFVTFCPTNCEPGIYALSQSTGAVVWNTVIQTSNKQIYASPIAFNGMIYVGAAGDYNDAEVNTSTVGAIFGLNESTGKLVWTFNTEKTGPGITSTGGDGVWGSVAVDPILNSIYFATGNPYGDSSNSMYGYSIISLNAKTGVPNWVTPVYKNLSTGQDNDFGSTPNLFTADIGNTIFNAIGVGNKDGKYYILNRANGAMLENFSVGTDSLDGIRGVSAFYYVASNPLTPEVVVVSSFGSNALPANQGIAEAFYPSNGAIAWKYQTPGELTGSATLIPGAVLFGDNFSNFYAINVSTGSVILQKNFGSGILGGITAAEGYIFVPLAGTFGTSQPSGIRAFAVPKSASSVHITLPSSVSVSSGTALVPVTVSGSGFVAGDLINFGYSSVFPPNSNAIANAIVGPAGTWSATFTAPFIAGSYQMTAIDANNLASASATLVVVNNTSSQGNGGEWTSFTLNNNDSRYQANSTITQTNIAGIVEDWHINASTVTSTPIVVGGNVYFDDWNGNVYSANVSTGTINWDYHAVNSISSTVAVENGVVYVGFGPQNTTELLALNQSTGTKLWVTGFGSMTNEQAVWASPIAYNGLVYVGAAGSSQFMNSSRGGTIFAFNSKTGSLVWTFNTEIGNTGGAGVWGSVVIDPQQNAVLFGTGNPYVGGVNSIYAYSVMSLNAQTGALNWYHRAHTNFNVSGDVDFGSSPNLFTLKLNGVTYNAIGIGSKDGTYYILDTATGNQLETFTLANDSLDGIRGLPGFIYPSGSSATGAPEIFVPSNYSTATAPKNAGLPAVTGNTLGLGIVEAIYPSNGVVSWIYQTSGEMTGSVSIVPGAVIFGDSIGNIYALNTTTGAVIMQRHFGTAILAGITPAEGHLFVPLSGFGSQPAGIVAFSLSNTNVPHVPTLTLPISVTPSNNSVKSTVDVSGVGFTPGDLVNIGYTTNFPPTSNAIASATVSQSGIWSTTFHAPYLSATYSIMALDTNGVSATAQLVVSNSITSTTTSTTTSSTTTISSGSGGGGGVVQSSGGGGGSPGGGGSSKPIITNTTSGFSVNAVAPLNTFNLSICGGALNVTENYVTPNSTGIEINGQLYTLSVGESSQVLGFANGCNVALVNVSYLPIEHTASYQFSQFVAPAVVKSTSSNTTNVTKTNTTVPTTVATTSVPITVQPQVVPTNNTNVTNATGAKSSVQSGTSKTGEYIALAAISIVIIVIAAFGLTRGKKKKYSTPN